MRTVGILRRAPADVSSHARLAPYRRLLGNRDYRSWFASSLGSSLGDWIGVFALQVLAVQLAEPGSRVALFGLSAVMLARLLPSLLFGPVAGVFADRYSRRRLMIGADVLRGVLFAAVAFVDGLWAVLALVFAIECLSVLYLSAKNAILPALVDEAQLAQANQLTLLVTYGPLPLGAALDGLLHALGGRLGIDDPTRAALLVTGSLFVVAAVLLRWMRDEQPPDARTGGDGDGRGDGGPVARLREGIAEVRDRPEIRALAVGVLAVFFAAGALIALGPEFVRSDLDRSEGDWYGLMTTVGFGLLIGIAAAPTVAERFGQARTVAIALVGASAGSLVVAVLPTFRLVQVVGFVLAAFAGTAFVGGFTTLHARTAHASRGRVFAAVYTGTRATLFAALAFAPLLAGAIGGPSVTVGGRTLQLSGIRLVLLAAGGTALLGTVASAVTLRRTGTRDR